MHCCLNGITVNDKPKFLLKNPMVNDHAVIVPSDIDDSPLLIPLIPQDVTSYFPVQAATLSEYNSDVIPTFHLTAEAPAWDQGLSSHSLQEDSMLNFRRQIVGTVITTRGKITMQVNTVCSSPFASYCVIDAADDNNFGIYLKSYIQVYLSTTSKRAAVSHDELATHWSIHPDHAKAVVQYTTQQGVHTIANPALSQWVWTNDHHWCLCHPVFTNTIFSNTYSCRNNKCAHVFASDFSWVHIHSMKTKGEVHEALSLMFQQEGVPLSLVMDG